MQINRKTQGTLDQGRNHRIRGTRPLVTVETLFSQASSILDSQNSDVTVASTQDGTVLSTQEVTQEDQVITQEEQTPFTQDHARDNSTTEEQEARKAKIKFPSANSKEWEALDEDLEKILEDALKGDARKKLEKMSELVYEVCKERFGTEDRPQKTRTESGPSRRQREIGDIRRELRLLRTAYLNSREEERQGLAELRQDLRRRLLSLKAAERKRKKRAESRRTRSRFFKDPFGYIGEILGKPKSGKLCCTKEEMDKSIREDHSDRYRDVPLGDGPGIRPTPQPAHPFELGEIRLAEVKEVITKSRSKSAPGSNGISYKVYKRCPLLTRRLWKLIKVIWRKKHLPESWLMAEGCYVPKEENSTALPQFREISLLNVEGKVFWSIVAKRLSKFLTCNKYIDTAAQKGGVTGFAGCIEHTTVMTHMIGDAKRRGKDLAVAWLDLAKAYPNIPHQLIFQALRHYHVPEEVTGLVETYFGGLKMRFSAGSLTSNWQRLEKGIMAGCTVSVILFVAAMSVLIEEVKFECRGPLSSDGTRQPPCRAFMDDITIFRDSEIGMRWIMKRLDELA